LRIVPFKALKVVRIARMDKLPVRARVKVLPIGSAGVAVRGFGPFASGMAARKGEDPLRGFNAAHSPARRATPNFLLEEFRKDVATTNGERQSVLPK
jgi:hypothetical protein